MDPALHDQLVTARFELDALTAAVRGSPARAELAAAIARRDAVLSARRDGALAGVTELAALEGGGTASVGRSAPTASTRSDVTAMRYLEALEMGRREDAATLPSEELLHRMLGRLSSRDRDGDDRLPPIHAAIAGIGPDRTSSDSPARSIIDAAVTYRRLSLAGQPHAERLALARLASALILQPIDARRDDVVLAPQIDSRATNSDDRGLGGTSPGDEADRWLASFADGVAMTARRTRELVERLSALSDADRIRIDSLGKAAPSSHRVHRALQRWPIASIDRVMDASGLCVQAASSALHRLRGLGVIREITRRHRHRLYSYDGYVRIIADDVDSWVAPS